MFLYNNNALFVVADKGFDSRTRQEMSSLSSDWSCGLDSLFLSQIEIAYSGIVEHCLILGMDEDCTFRIV
uniref:Uncharacterized protein n=1 Tax=Populus trichocarpa TaxID=3694 RepID=A0A2K1X3X5_POPTR